MATSRFVALENIEEVLSRKLEIPTVVLWNRLEGRPRKENFIRALRAEVRDPLWMLCKQWQVGEFKGDDAGSPIVAKAHISTTKLTRYKPGLATGRAFDNQVPLEATVEQRPLPFFGQEHVLSLDIRLAMGRHWIKLLATPSSNDWSALAPLFIDQYGIDEPDPDARSDAHVFVAGVAALAPARNVKRGARAQRKRRAVFAD